MTIPEDLKQPKVFAVNPEEVKTLKTTLNKCSSNEELRKDLSDEQWKLIIRIVETFSWVVELLSIRRAGISIIRKVLNISLPKVSESKKKRKKPINKKKRVIRQLTRIIMKKN